MVERFFDAQIRAVERERRLAMVERPGPPSTLSEWVRIVFEATVRAEVTTKARRQLELKMALPG